ncbi:MAG TPA: hypothetical protein VM425_02805 [Myxococcota bacterium]|nr:hypothetical protein [Myxococcota bacterium]
MCWLLIRVFPVLAQEKVQTAIRIRPELRFLSVYSVNYEEHTNLFKGDTDIFSWTSFRLIVDGQPANWFGYEIHAIQNFALSTAEFVHYPSFNELGRLRYYNLINSTCGLYPQTVVDASMRSFLRPQGIYRITPAQWLWEDERNLQARLQLDRLNFILHFERADIRLGRQAIDLGGDWLFSPLDIFEPLDPRQFDRDHRFGVDALRLEIPFGSDFGLTVIGAAGSDEPGIEEPREFAISWYASAVMARFSGRLKSWSFAAQGGKVYGGYQAGGELEGKAGPVRMKAQGSYFFANQEDMLPDHYSGVVGIGLGSEDGLSGSLEYSFNNAGSDENTYVYMPRKICGRCMQRAEHLLGLLLGWHFIDTLSVTLLAMVEIPDAAWLQPGISYRASANLELTAGAMIPVGGRPATGVIIDNPWDPGAYARYYPVPISDFGTYPYSFFFQLKLIGSN